MIRMGSILRLACLSAWCSTSALPQIFSPSVVINELHYDDVPKTSRGEFVELFNAGTLTVDLSEWRLAGVGNYTFPAGTNLEPGQFLVVAEDSRTLRTKYRIRTTHQYTGGLDNDGDNLRLFDSKGNLVDQVEYQSGYPWPTAARGKGASMELLNPSLDNNLGGSWRSSETPTPGTQNTVLTLNIPPQTRQVNHRPLQPS